METLNKFSEFRRPKRPYLRVQTRKISFENEVLTLGVILGIEAEEKVYIKVKPFELLVSCSVDTDESYLSRYAYFALCDIMGISEDYDFDGFYWPDLTDTKMQSKFLMTIKSKENLHVVLKVRYHGLYKPGTYLPIFRRDKVRIKETVPIIAPEAERTADHLKLGYNLAYTNHDRWHTSHYPFLIPYIGIAGKDETVIKGFNRYLFKESDLSGEKLTAGQEQLNNICFLMKAIALIDPPQNKGEDHTEIEKQKLNRANFCRLFELWHEAFPLLEGKRYSHSRFTFGMRNVKRKPPKSEMRACTFSNEQVELCFVWKEKPDYYKLELRFMRGGQLYDLPRYLITSFFAVASGYPRKYYLLNSITDCDVLEFFSGTDFKMLFLKVHYEAYFQYFIEPLRKLYKFINR
ncbi:hypothetical protein HDE69_002027 [Pedobacter cryoconitis]|uniref:Uncharacterized protein n=1 Tax=Pedobacter cryoconitis TaxID=188932 RepID=A0A7W8YSI7_9SPHI|nr:hypothetical protein [Pedobacter cryoconitis]MBB5620974.1 hypothetical protein [Pedobacter cryoconitis]